MRRVALLAVRKRKCRAASPGFACYRRIHILPRPMRRRGNDDETPRLSHDRCSRKFVAANDRARPRCLAATEHHNCGAVSGGGFSRLGGSFVCAAFSGEVSNTCRRRKQKRGGREHWGGHRRESST